MLQGVLAEYRVIPMLVQMGFQVAVPCDPDCPYDLLVDNGVRILRVQVKSCNVKKRNRYRVCIAFGAGNRKRPYAKNSFDFFLAFIPEEDAWYVIPLHEVQGQKWVSVYPHDECGMYEVYRNNWSLLSCG